MTAHADLAEVRAALDLVAQATPGPWSARIFTTHVVDSCQQTLGHEVGSQHGTICEAPPSVFEDETAIGASNIRAIVALRNAAPAIAAAVGELERLRAEIAALERQVCRLVSGQEIDGDRLCQHHGADVAALALLSDERAAHAETSRDLDALLTALGAQVTPGGQTLESCHARRVADGMRRAAACAVPADFEAAIASLVAAARDATNYEPDRTTAAKHLAAERSVKEEIDALRAAIAAEIERARAEGRGDLDAELRRAVELRAQAVREAHSGALAGLEEAARLELEAAGLASYGDSPETTAREAHIFAVRCVKRAVAAEARLRESPAAPATVARPISEWHEDRGSALWWRFPVEEPPYSGSPLDSDWPGYHTHWTPIVCPDDPPSESPAAPATVGGLLATAPIGAFVEWLSPEHDGWCRTVVGQSQMVISRWFEYPPKWTRPGFGAYPSDLRQPARLVPASEADADPASRGPIGAPNQHPDGCHTADATAPRDCTGDGHYECASCTRKIGGGS